MNEHNGTMNIDYSPIGDNSFENSITFKRMNNISFRRWHNANAPAVCRVRLIVPSRSADNMLFIFASRKCLQPGRLPAIYNSYYLINDQWTYHFSRYVMEIKEKLFTREQTTADDFANKACFFRIYQLKLNMLYYRFSPVSCNAFSLFVQLTITL